MKRARLSRSWIASIVVAFVVGTVTPVTQAATAPQDANESIKVLVGRLDLERYKAAIKGLTQFGDRRQGTGCRAAPPAVANRAG
jgi:hypothetical protein